MPLIRIAALAAIAGLVGLGGCAGLPAAAPALPDEVRQAMAQAGLPMSALGLVAYPLDGQGQALRLNAEVPMQPASTMKLLTGAVALDRLGMAWRGRTELLLDSAPAGELVNGPLYLRGGADTDLDWGALWQMLRQLREERGVREIRGGLVVDRTLFRPARPDLGAPPFDETPEADYNAIPDALQLNGNLLGLTLRSDAAGRVRADTVPAWPGLAVDASALKPAELPCPDWAQAWKTPLVLPVPMGRAEAQVQHVVLQGAFPRQCSQREEFSQLFDRQWVTAQAVRQIWRELGGTMGGAAASDREAATPAGAVLMASHQGRPLGEWMRGMMKRSDNGLARLSYLQLGAGAALGEEPTLDAAGRVVRGWLQAHGIDAQGLVLENGSGLSREERIKPEQLAALLRVAHDGPQGPELLAMLPVAGVDGSLRHRLKGTAAEGRARMKTGSLRDTVALAGYVTDSRRRLWVVVGIVNDRDKAEQGQAVLDALAGWVARQ